jgi:hypothetical protein
MKALLYKTGETLTVQKYLISREGEESIWFIEISGRYVIGVDCEMINLEPKIEEAYIDGFSDTKYDFDIENYTEL